MLYPFRSTMIISQGAEKIQNISKTMKQWSEKEETALMEYSVKVGCALSHSGSLTLAGFQVPTKAIVILHSLAGQEENIEQKKHRNGDCSHLSLLFLPLVKSCSSLHLLLLWKVSEVFSLPYWVCYPRKDTTIADGLGLVQSALSWSWLTLTYLDIEETWHRGHPVVSVPLQPL